MKSLAMYIIHHKRFIIIAYIILIILSLVGTRLVNIQYDLSSYLPKEMNSIAGRDSLSEEFGINGSASLIVKGMEPYQVVDLKNDIQKLPQVKKVVWLDDFDEIEKPLEFFDEAISERFISGEYSLLQIQFFGSNDDIGTKDAISEIDNMIDIEHYIGGPSAVSADMRDTVSREIIYYSIAAFVVISIILLLSSSSFLEPILFFIPVGVAIAINMGTNFIFGSVSSNTHSVAGIIQLAVSMDYSIFLIHRYREESQRMDSEVAMACAMEKTFSSVSASALTTVFGFLALAAMKYEMGRDMGLVLAKGVLLSLICVVTLMPCIVLVSERLLKNHNHRILMPNFKRSSKWLVWSRYIALIIALIIVVPVFLGQSKLNYYYSTEKTLSNKSGAAVANQRIRQVFGNNNDLVLVIPKDDKVKTAEMIEDIKSQHGVEYVQGLYSMADYTLPDSFIPDKARDAFESGKFTFLNIRLYSPTEGSTGTEGSEVSNIIKGIRDTSASYFDKWYLTGEAAVYLDLKEVTSRDFGRVTILSIILIGLTLVVTFKSIGIPLILIFVIQLGIWINLSIPYFQGISLNFISFIIIGAIQLGATVDYAILFTTRYRENLEYMPRLDAARKTIEDTGRSVLTSALILMAGTFSVSFITTIKSASELTLLIGRGALISMVLVYTLLPGLLVISDKFIRLTTIGWSKKIKN